LISLWQWRSFSDRIGIFCQEKAILRTTFSFFKYPHDFRLLRKTGFSQNKDMAKHRFFDTTDLKFDEYYSNLFFQTLFIKITG